MMEGPGADSEEKHEPASDIDIAVVDSLKVLDPKWPIREADMKTILKQPSARVVLEQFGVAGISRALGLGRAREGPAPVWHCTIDRRQRPMSDFSAY